MQAIVQDRFGSPDVLRVDTVPVPKPGKGEVLVRVIASSANPRDWHYLRGVPYIARPTMGLREPRFRLPGSDIAGIVESAGTQTTRFGHGDEVIAYVQSGGFSELTAVPEVILGRKPSNLTFEEAATVPLAGTAALQGLRFGGVRAGQRLLIVGASGGLGTFAIQIAKAWGVHVTGVCSTQNVDLVRSLGADEVIDYKREDFTAGAPRFDVVFQLGGTASASRIRRVLKRDGVLVLNSGDAGGRWFGPFGRIIGAKFVDVIASQKIGTFEAEANAEDLEILRTLIEAGQVRPVIDRTYALSETPEAIRRVETGHVQGKLAISVQPLTHQPSDEKSVSLLDRASPVEPRSRMLAPNDEESGT
jgi:NADPH:quinone reductase-like Zn-dependent oxidoreductase